MHRSASSTRVSDEFYMKGSSAAMAAGIGGGRSSLEMDHLPTYDPQSDVSKKEAIRARFAENMIHLIPLVLILCAFVLWFFSSPEADVVNRDDSIIARIKNMTIDGYSNWNGSSLTVGEDLDPIDGIGTDEIGRDSDAKDPE